MSSEANWNPDDPDLKTKVVHISGKAGGMLVGNRHRNQGIKAINKSTGKPLEMEGGEVVITRNAVSDPTLRTFNGEKLTNRQILSKINESGGGVAFAEGGKIPEQLLYEDKSYEFGGETCGINDIILNISKCGCDEAESYADGGELQLSPSAKYRINSINAYPALFNEENPDAPNLIIQTRIDNKLTEFNSLNYHELTKKVTTETIFPDNRVLNIGLLKIGEHPPTTKSLVRFKLVRGNKKNTTKQLNTDNYSFLDQPNDILRLLNTSPIAKQFNWANYFFAKIKPDNQNEEKSKPPISPPEIISADEITVEVIETLDALALEDNFLTEDQYNDAIDFLNSELTINRMSMQLQPMEFEGSTRLDLITAQKKLLETKFLVISERRGNSFGILSSILKRLSVNEKYVMKNDDVNEIGSDLYNKSIVFSDEFKNWFGDWEKSIETNNTEFISKAVDQNGHPIVYYNGSRRKKYSYNEGSNNVFYLARSRNYAEWFAKNGNARSIDGNFLMKCYVSLKNPIDLSVFKTDQVEFSDIITYISVFYPSAKIFEFLPSEISEKIILGEPTGLKIRAWQVIRNYPKLNAHLRENTEYDGFIYYENNPSDIVNGKENITEAIAVFKSSQVKLMNASMFDPELIDFRFNLGGEI